MTLVETWAGLNSLASKMGKRAQVREIVGSTGDFLR